MIHRTIISLYILSILCSFFFCSTVDVTGGSSSTDNGKITGKICSESGLPAPNTQVTLRADDADPYRDTIMPLKDTTDSEGTYQFESLASGIYTIEAVAIGNRKRALVTSLPVDSATTHASTASLTEPGALEIRIPDCSATTSCYVYVPGTSCFGEVRNGIGYIDSVPAGYIPAIYYTDLEKPATIHRVTTGISLDPGATRVITDYSGWKYSKMIVLNTTPDGAGISSNVYDFPVLIRLTEADFNFEEAQPDGGDLRFEKSDDTPLAYEIERWDPATGLAEVWVLIDTVFGNDSTRFFRMYWGNTEVQSESNSEAVFDTAAGFQGVWHLAGEEDADDATGNHYNGTLYSASATSGAIGTACGFDGISSYIVMHSTAESKLDFPQTGTYSMSLWVYADSFDTLWHAIAGKGHEQYYMQLKCLGENRATWEFVEFQENRGWEYTEDSVPPAPGTGEWLHVVGVRSGNNQWLYINGKLAVNEASLMSGDYPRDRSDDFTIGRFGQPVSIPYEQGWSYFRGKIDEVRITNVALTADRIYLSYANQKTDNVLVNFR